MIMSGRSRGGRRHPARLGSPLTQKLPSPRLSLGSGAQLTEGAGGPGTESIPCSLTPPRSRFTTLVPGFLSSKLSHKPNNQDA